MRKLTQITGAFLQALGKNEPEPLGPSAAQIAPAREQIDALAQRLSVAARDSRLIVSAIIGVCALVAVGGIVLAVAFRDQAKLVGAIFGGTSGSTIVFAVTVMRTAWRDKYQMDMLAGLLPMLPPAEALRVVEKIYFSCGTKRASRRPRTSASAKGTLSDGAE